MFWSLVTSIITEQVHFFVKDPAEAHFWVQDFYTVGDLLVAFGCF